ncbi:MAG TPA: hypothetical protein VMU13_03760 [Candidatus Paceibacterota bacterium]|nr:hypothetical protein [Candidatus Paceibacterota bacterium]
MEPSTKIQRGALAITKWVGSPQSIFLHTILFVIGFSTVLLNILPLDTLLLILNTIVSLEAIYLALFIQMTVNYTTTSIKEVGEDIEEIQENIEEISEDVGELQEDVGEISEDVGEISEDVEELNEEDAEHEAHTTRQQQTLATIQTDLRKLMEDIERLKTGTN